MAIRYRVLQAAVAFLVALGFVALGGTWAWAQQEESGLAAQQGGECPGARVIGTIGPTRDERIVTELFDIDGDKFRITYKTTDLDEDSGPFLDVTVLDEDDDEVGGRLIREEGTQKEIVNEGPGKFFLDIGAASLRYEITVEDCTGDDGFGGNDGSNDRDRNNNRDNNRDGSNGNNRSSNLDRSPAEGQYGRSLDIDDDLGLGDNPGFGIGQDANIPDDVIADTVPDRKLPFTGGPPLFGLAFIGLACAGLGFAVLRRAIRRS
jgi:hypothetical protein